jgi:phosphoribosyl-AMP cyclohydrolase / phosphoribosyl-ATP pyrophosphohydrolase
MTIVDPSSLDWAKGQGLIPAVVQHADTRQVLMVAWMNETALRLTQTDRYATFYSRSRSALWRKGETSGYTIAVTDVVTDCDRDTLLVFGRPVGPVCHTGAATCFATQTDALPLSFLGELEALIDDRIAANSESSYTAKTYARGTSRMAQKVGEEGLEVALAAVQRDRAALVSESADLLFHLLLLLRSEGLSLTDVTQELSARHSAQTAR